MVTETERTPEAPPEVTPEATPELDKVAEEAAQPSEPEVSEGTTEETAEATTEVEEPEPADLTDIISGFDAEDSPHREAWQEFVKERKAEGWAEAQQSYSEHFQRTEAAQAELRTQQQQAIQAAKTVMGRLDKKLGEGMVDAEGLREVFQDPTFAKAYAALGDKMQEEAASAGAMQGRIAGGFDSLKYGIQTLSKVIGKPSLLQEYGGQVDDAITDFQQGRPVNQKVATIWQDFGEALKKAAYDQGRSDERKGLTEKSNLEQRKGEKPAQGVGTTGGKSINSMAEADAAYARGEMSHADYKAARQRFNQPDRSTFGR